ncbi:MAG: hypothetical protein AVDCRST_MAG89-2563 [uncultured Gemmatimonadetes bacterium]|uniref:Uncharacterized protein n=1 Tax=uncultured Gemmatimonadota bacterium TaxID=203437 RepID=A0A6J4LSS0_9BACT|nr:MAG: hypothetical protein AVDCRST_MAG89-2563 [uncultured Gemmatimonadota bacterium]
MWTRPGFGSTWGSLGFEASKNVASRMGGGTEAGTSCLQ